MPTTSNQRKESRRKLNGLLPGRLQTHSGIDIRCKPVNVSQSGLGLIIQEQFQAGSELKLVLKEIEIILRIAWGQPDFGKKDLFRYGLEVKDKSIDLEQLFIDLGYFQD